MPSAEETIPTDILRYHFKTIESTQIYARTKLHEVSAEHGLLITADQQTEGITQTYNRLWLSPPSCNIAATFALPFPQHKKHLILHLPQITALTIAYVLEKHQVHVAIKWINDIFLEGKKVSGILCQNIPATEEHTQIVLIGIGLNVNMPATFFALADQPITSLMVATGHPWDREILLHELQAELLLQLQKLVVQGFAPFVAEIEKRLAFIREPIHFRHQEKIIAGCCEGISAQGALKIRLPDNTLVSYMEGRIVLPYQQNL